MGDRGSLFIVQLFISHLIYFLQTDRYNGIVEGVAIITRSSVNESLGLYLHYGSKPPKIAKLDTTSLCLDQLLADDEILEINNQVIYCLQILSIFIRILDC